MSNTNNDLREIKTALEQIGSDTDPQAIGKMIASEIGVGIEQNSYLAVTAMENVYVELETLYKNAAKNREALEKKQHARALSNLKNSLKLNLITEQEYYEKLKQYRDEHFRQGTDNWYKYTEEIIFYNKRLADEAEKQQEQVLSIRNKLLSQIQELRDEISGNLGSVGNDWFSQNKLIFKGQGKWGSDLVYNTSGISDFETELELLSKYRNAISQLEALGNIPGGIFADIAKMDVAEGLSAAMAILNADSKKREDFISGYNKLHGLADSIATELMPILGKEELEEIGEDAAAAFNTAFFKTDDEDKTAFINMLEESFSNIPESYYSLGEDSATSFHDGLLSRLPEVMSDIRSFISGNIGSIVSGLAATVSPSATAVGSGNTYNSNYVFNSSRDTTTQQLLAAQRAETLSRLRGFNKSTTYGVWK